MLLGYIEIRTNAKIRNQYNQLQHLIKDSVWESDKLTGKHHIQESLKVNPFPQVTALKQETGMAAWQRQTQITKMIHKRSTALEGSVRRACIYYVSHFTLAKDCQNS